MPKFELVSSYQPTGDQPTAIEELVAGIKAGKKTQVLLGGTGYQTVEYYDFFNIYANSI